MVGPLSGIGSVLYFLQQALLQVPWTTDCHCHCAGLPDRVSFVSGDLHDGRSEQRSHDCRCSDFSPLVTAGDGTRRNSSCRNIANHIGAEQQCMGRWQHPLRAIASISGAPFLPSEPAASTRSWIVVQRQALNASELRLDKPRLNRNAAARRRPSRRNH